MAITEPQAKENINTILSAKKPIKTNLMKFEYNFKICWLFSNIGPPVTKRFKLYIFYL